MATVTQPGKLATSWREKLGQHWQSILGLCLVSGIFNALYKGGDSWVLHQHIVSENNTVAAAAYLIVGGTAGVVLGVLFGQLLGCRLIDPTFRGFVLRNRAMHKEAFIAGIWGGMGTFAIMFANQKADPAAVAAVGSLAVIVTAAYDVYLGQIRLKRFIIPALIAITGGILASLGKSGTINEIVLLAAGLSALFGGIAEISEQRGTRASDGVNFFVWRFFWLVVWGTAVSVMFVAIQGNLNMLAERLQTISFSVYMIITVTMFFVFLSIGTGLVAKKAVGVSVAHVLLLRSSIGLLATIPVTFIGAGLVPGAFGFDVPSDGGMLLLRVSGILFLLVGIYYLQKMHTKPG